MRYQDQLSSMKACVTWLDSIGYTGSGRQGLARCIAAFEEGDPERAIAEYRHTIGDAPNFASAMTDLEDGNFSSELSEQHFNRVMAVMYGMCLLMGGDVK
jgi:hypothetical protein